jgi:hypothetical protein
MNTNNFENACAVETVMQTLRTAQITASPEAITVLAQLRPWDTGKQVRAVGKRQLTPAHYTDVMIERMVAKYKLATNLFHIVEIVKLLASTGYRGLANIAIDPVSNPALHGHLCVLCVNTTSVPMLRAVELPMQAFPKNTVWIFLQGRTR